MATAVLVDGDFFLKQFRRLRGKREPDATARSLHAMCLQHLHQKQESKRRALYRIFFYDCPPLQKKAHNPVTGEAIDFSKSDVATFRHSLHQELCKQRKVALRLGHLSDHQKWIIKPHPGKRLLRGEISVNDLGPDDVQYSVRQKGVDMKIGLDIASLAYKKQVDQIVLISGDADFVPAAKLARREGIDFVLDPMWRNIPSGLEEHVDGVRTVTPHPQSAAAGQAGDSE